MVDGETTAEISSLKWRQTGFQGLITLIRYLRKTNRQVKSWTLLLIGFQKVLFVFLCVTSVSSESAQAPRTIPLLSAAVPTLPEHPNHSPDLLKAFLFEQSASLWNELFISFVFAVSVFFLRLYPSYWTIVDLNYEFIFLSTPFICLPSRFYISWVALSSEVARALCCSHLE